MEPLRAERMRRCGRRCLRSDLAAQRGAQRFAWASAESLGRPAGAAGPDAPLIAALGYGHGQHFSKLRRDLLAERSGWSLPLHACDTCGTPWGVPQAWWHD